MIASQCSKRYIWVYGKCSRFCVYHIHCPWDWAIAHGFGSRARPLKNELRSWALSFSAAWPTKAVSSLEHVFVFFLVSDPLCLSSSSALRFFLIIHFGSTTLITRMTCISSHMQWPLAFQSQVLETCFTCCAKRASLGRTLQAGLPDGLFSNQKYQFG
jgi:hypothetical protein